MADHVGMRRHLCRTLVVAALSLVVLAGLVVVGGGWWLRTRVESALAGRIEHRLPGSSARVQISSFPFLAHLAASGEVLKLTAHLNHLSAGPVIYNHVRLKPIDFSDVNIVVQGVKLRRDRLFHRQVKIESIRSTTITAIISQSSVDQTLRLPVVLGAGTVGIGGLSMPATLTVRGQRMILTAAHGFTLSFASPPAVLLPCTGQVDVYPGALHVSCGVHRLPPVLQPLTYRF
jgi:LmeA-like phospholipid-binding